MIRKWFIKARTIKDELLFGQEIIKRRVNTLAVIERERYVKELLSDPKYNDKKRLEIYGFKVCSWSGLWIEGSENFVSQINVKFQDVVSNGRLRVKAAFITPDNINGLIGEHFTGEMDLLSIDIDGNDIHVLDAIDVIRPRVVVIEYNGKFPPPMNVVQRYNPEHRWKGTDYGGSSLVAITKIAGRKGYSLVGCGIAGVNAFFVRDDLLGDKFQAPFTAENHYQPARYFLWQTYVSGHAPDWGPYETV